MNLFLWYLSRIVDVWLFGIYFLPGLTYVQRLESTGLKTIWYRFTIENLVLYYKYIYGWLRVDNIFKLCPPNLRNFNLRKINGLMLLRPPISHIKNKFITYSVCNLWNKLPPHVVLQPNPKLFRKSLYAYTNLIPGFLNSLDPTDIS